jgi:C-terminal processing protease CtpA/Prc
LDRPVIREDTGVFVTKIRPKGVAAKHGGLAPGDRILEVSKMIAPATGISCIVP